MNDVFFGGTVLPPVPSDPTDAADPTFRFNRAERNSLNLRGIPIVMEHSTRERDVIGEAVANYTLKSGETVMIGKLSGNSVKSRFARHALAGDDPWYGSLSLCHAHVEYSDGRTEKIPKEVSLCKHPRREGSDIFILDRQTKKKQYIKTTHAASNMTSSDQTAKITATSAKTTEVVAPDEKIVESTAAVVHKASSETAPTLVNDQSEEMLKLQEIIIAQQKDLESSRKASEQESIKAQEMQAKLNVIHEAAVTKAAEEAEAAKQKAELIAKTLVDSLQAELPTSIGEDMKESFRAIAKMAPVHARAVYELMHEASVRHGQKKVEFAQSLKDARHASVQKQFDDVMNKRKTVAIAAPVSQKRAAPVVTEVRHQAASSDSWLRKALGKYSKSSGHARNTMKNVQARNRELFMPSEASYSKRRRFN